MSGSRGGSSNFGVRLSLDGAEAVESGLRRVQASAAQTGQAVTQAGESTGRALTVIERGTQAASSGLTKLGGDFAALAPVVESAGGAVGRLVTALGAGAGLLGVLGGVAALVGTTVALYQNWDAATRAVGSAVDTLTGRVRLNAEAIATANTRLTEFIRLSETAAQAGVRGQVAQQVQFAEGFRNDLVPIDRNIAALEASLARARDGGGTGRVIAQGGASGLVPTDEFGQAADRAARDRVVRQNAAEVARIEGDLRVARAERQRIEAARLAAQGNIAALGEAAGTVINPRDPITQGVSIYDSPAGPSSPSGGRGGGGGGGRSGTNDVAALLRERDSFAARVDPAERYRQTLESIAALNDRLAAAGQSPLPDEVVLRATEEAMREYQRATENAVRSTSSLADSTKDLERAGGAAAKALAGAFEELVFEGESFDDVLKNLERSLLRIGNQYLLTPLFQRGFDALLGGGQGAGAAGGAGGGAAGILGSIGSLFAASGGAKGAIDAVGLVTAAAPLFHTGGMVGDTARPTRFVPAAAFADAPRFHSGGMVGPGIFGPDERPVIAQVGERILNRRETAAYNRGGGVTININGVKDPNAFRSTESQLSAFAARTLGRSNRNR